MRDVPTSYEHLLKAARDGHPAVVVNTLDDDGERVVHVIVVTAPTRQVAEAACDTDQQVRAAVAVGIIGGVRDELDAEPPAMATYR